MEDIDRGLHPAVDGQSLDEDEDEVGLNLWVESKKKKKKKKNPSGHTRAGNNSASLCFMGQSITLVPSMQRRRIVAVTVTASFSATTGDTAG